MASRWQRIVSLRGKLRKQAAAVLHLQQRELGDVETALAEPCVPELSSGGALQTQDAIREILRRREHELVVQVDQHSQDLRDKAIAAKQVEYLLDHDAQRETQRENRREQVALETWQQNRSRKDPQ